MGTGIPRIDQQLCIGCGNCVAWCPVGAVRLEGGKAVVARPEDCHYCTDCEAVCPVGAIACPFDIILAGGENGEETRQTP